MGINREAIKRNAKTRIYSTKPSPVLVALVYVAIAYILNLLSSKISGYSDLLYQQMDSYLQGNYDFVLTMPELSTFAYLLLAAIALMSTMLSVGFTIHCMKICQEKKGGFSDLFEGFALFFKVIWLYILMYVFVWLWTLLFIIPGIVAAYRYRMAIYILIDNPELGALECIRRSKAMMMEHKGELFVLDLSFIGWQLLTAIPFVTIWVTPYATITYVNYYLALRDMPQQTVV